MQENNTAATAPITTQHVSLLTRFAAVEVALRGLVATLWLPGRNRRFDGALRAVRGTRPLALTLEVGEAGELTLAGAISRARNGAIRFETIMKYDLTHPIRAGNQGAGLDARNEVIARRGLALLAALVRTGDRGRRGSPPGAASRRGSTPAWYTAPVFPRVLVPVTDPVEYNEAAVAAATEHITDHVLRGVAERRLRQAELAPDGARCYDTAVLAPTAVAAGLAANAAFEDYNPVTGVAHVNPARRLVGSLANPARRVLAEAGVPDLDAASVEDWGRLIPAFRAALPLGERLVDDNDVIDYLARPDAPVEFGNETLRGISPPRLVAAMRDAAGSDGAAATAAADDLLAAAVMPSRPMIIRHLSAIQVVPAQSLADLPAPYAGWFLPRPDWAPRAAAARVEAEG